ncbi:MAG TPA: hypothetical protein DGB32_09860 [Dehalococcoidia bacterium]|nr:hypothetical protein [Chloroflexota bacterium]HCV28620.1 hypothetical protein [Dehalococcoidia bacterium]
MKEVLFSISDDQAAFVLAKRRSDGSADPVKFRMAIMPRTTAFAVRAADLDSRGTRRIVSPLPVEDG